MHCLSPNTMSLATTSLGNQWLRYHRFAVMSLGTVVLHGCAYASSSFRPSNINRHGRTSAAVRVVRALRVRRSSPTLNCARDQSRAASQT